jgi:hypothetical protein
MQRLVHIVRIIARVIILLKRVKVV